MVEWASAIFNECTLYLIRGCFSCAMKSGCIFLAISYLTPSCCFAYSLTALAGAWWVFCPRPLPCS